jgi:abortive infection bacteriophage resistance protein
MQQIQNINPRTSRCIQQQQMYVFMRLLWDLWSEYKIKQGKGRGISAGSQVKKLISILNDISWWRRICAANTKLYSNQHLEWYILRIGYVQQIQNYIVISILNDISWWRRICAANTKLYSNRIFILTKVKKVSNTHQAYMFMNKTRDTCSNKWPMWKPVI